MEFDFETWSRLARDDPQEFERRRRALLREAIESAPIAHQRRLEGLQFQIDMERRRAGSALGSCLKLNAMMWSGFIRLRDQLNAPSNEKPIDAAVAVSAEIIPIDRARGPCLNHLRTN